MLRLPIRAFAPLLCTTLLVAASAGAALQHTQTTAGDAEKLPAGPAQITAERNAIAILQTPDVQKAINLEEARWKAQWPNLSLGLYSHLHASVEEAAFLVALGSVNNDARRPQVVQVSMSPHTWCGIQVPGGRAGVDNPDTQYFVAAIEQNSSYLLHGVRHGRGPIDSNFSVLHQANQQTLSNIAQSDLHLAKDGTFQITLDARPALGRSNHLQLAAGADELFIRNTLGDWSNEDVDSLWIERVAGPAPLPARTEAALVTDAIAQLHRLVDGMIKLQTPILQLPANNIPQPGKPADKIGFLVTQRNTLGHFHLQPDQALVVTAHPGGAAYMTLPVTNIWGVSLDYWQRQSSLNNRQADTNPDGTITYVLSGWDPGVANWVDTGGLEEGILMLRWQRLSEDPELAAKASVSTRLVSRANLASALPPGTRRISHTERDQQLRRRHSGFLRRLVKP